jgi:N-methylhydantoinase B/oxoprolinase/acetone carboxylase alpha subunit
VRIRATRVRHLSTGCILRRGIVPDTEGAAHAMGARRGGRGALAQAQKRARAGSLTALPGCYCVALEPGEFVVSDSAGGGGYGPPFERDPGGVLYDLLRLDYRRPCEVGVWRCDDR